MSHLRQGLFLSEHRTVVDLLPTQEDVLVDDVVVVEILEQATHHALGKCPLAAVPLDGVEDAQLQLRVVGEQLLEEALQLAEEQLLLALARRIGDVRQTAAKDTAKRFDNFLVTKLCPMEENISVGRTNKTICKKRL